jgi:hypothetical protein
VRISLETIALYGHEGQIRPLQFWPDRLNIITGESKTGKSAIIHIVNYCLGSGECHVPEGIIRRKVAWYAVVLRRNQERIFIARQNPEKGRATSSNICLRAGVSMALPQKADLIKNTDLEGLQEFLTRLVGIDENLHVPAEGYTRDPLAANFAHSRIYCFQEQSLIDNKNQLFFNQSDSFVAQAIRDTLPYFLGAVSTRELGKQHELSELRREARLLERQLDLEVSWQQASEARAGSLLAEARQVGLVRADARQTTSEQTFALLRQTLQQTLPSIAEPADFQAELNELMTERENLRRSYTETKDRLEETRLFGSDRDQYENELVEQSERLKALNLFPQHDDELLKCPLCESVVESAAPQLNALRRELIDISGRISVIRGQNPRLQAYVNEIGAQLEDVSNRLRENQGQINAVVQQNEGLRGQQENAVRRSRVQGRISAFLEESSAQDRDDRRMRFDLLQSRIAQLAAELSGENYEDRLQNVEFVLSEYMTEYARELQLEHSDGRTRLDLRRLSVVADTRHGSIRLENMGSGDNWVGCHVLTHMALHRLFRERDRPVPAFVIFDQPSKAHYPPSEDQLPESEIKDDDRAAVIRLFKFLYDHTADGGGFQTIVIDHADESETWFQQSILERWRGGNKLVPDDWSELG